MIVNNRIIPGTGGIGITQGNQSTTGITKPNSSFEDIFAKKLFENKEVKFSKHAENRLQTRDIQLTDDQKSKLNEAINKAGEKNVKESLVMVDDIAFVVNVREKNVVTVLNKDEMKNNVFTNIDGAVIA
jgi:flagellar operon protein